LVGLALLVVQVLKVGKVIQVRRVVLETLAPQVTLE